MKSSADLIVETENPGQIYRALLPEWEDDLHRSRVRMDLCDGGLRLRIEGDDVTSLRAAFNTWMRLIKIALEMEEI